MRASLRPSRTMAMLLLASLGTGLVLSVARLLALPLVPLTVGLLCGAAFVALAHRARRRKARATLARPNRPRVLPGGRTMGRKYDLAKDRSTDGQRWLM